jgi:hypothetical protein
MKEIRNTNKDFIVNPKGKTYTQGQGGNVTMDIKGTGYCDMDFILMAQDCNQCDLLLRR